MTTKSRETGMSLLVDTSVWSLAFRRDSPPQLPEVIELKRALESGDEIVVTGLIVQELLQGFNRPKAQAQILDYFKSLLLISPDQEDHIKAAELHNRCRKKGIQTGTIDALLAQLCIRHDFHILTTDKDFTHISKVVGIKIWSAP
ncbi:MAG: PIN domain-containing protein [Gammaproteobacteria bacterium]|nr:PIN domain-containing protein [Gammaproteobacteria bacterium]